MQQPATEASNKQVGRLLVDICDKKILWLITYYRIRNTDHIFCKLAVFAIITGKRRAKQVASRKLQEASSRKLQEASNRKLASCRKTQIK